MRLRNVEEAILRFEPIGQDRALNNPVNHSVDYTLLKDLVTDHINSLQKLNLKLGASAEIAAKLGELKAAYETIFGKPVVDSIGLTEAYQDRVQQVADAVVQRGAMTKEEMLSAIENEARYAGVAELKFKDTPRSTAWRDFVKDVLAALKGRAKFSRPGVTAAAAERKARTEKLLGKIASIIDDSFGYAFPDGDPEDYIFPRVERLGVDSYEIRDWLDKAARKHLHAKSFDEYMGSVYDNLISDNPEMAMTAGLMTNPYTGKPVYTAASIKQLMLHNPRRFVDALQNFDVIKLKGVLDVLNNDKPAAVKAILLAIKQDPESDAVKRTVRNLTKAELDWDELEKIQRSIDPATIAESNVQPGDVFMLEDIDQAIVGTVLSFDNDTIIVEGDVYTFNAQEVASHLEEAKTSYEVEITPEEYKELLHNGIKLWKHSYNPSNHTLTVYASTHRAAKDLARMLDKHIEFGATSAAEVLGLNEAEYHGREVKLGKPMPGDVKKYKVFVKDPKTGNVKKVNFGDKGMEIKRDNPERRKSFRARHGCGTPRASDRTKAAYWSCRMWSSKPVSKILKGK